MLSVTGEATGVAKKKAEEILSSLSGLTIEEALRRKAPAGGRRRFPSR